MEMEKMPVRCRLFLAAALLLGVFTRTYRLGDKILWIDEGIMWKMAHRPIGEIIEYYRLEQHSPLPQIFDYFWVRLVGDSMFALHLEPALLSISALMIFALTVFRFFPWRVALAATTAFSLSAFVPEFAQTFRYQSLGIFFAAVWFAALLGYKAKGKVSMLILYLLSLTLFVHTHLYLIFVVVSLSVYLILFRREFERKLLLLLVANCVAVASLVPKVVQITTLGVMAKAPGAPLSEVLKHLMRAPVGGVIKVFYSFFAGMYVEPEALHPALLAVMLVSFGAVIFMSFRHRGFRSEVWLCAIVIGGTVFLVWLGMLFRGSPFSGRYFAPLSIFFSLMLGVGADRAARWKPALLPVMFVLYAAVSFSFLSYYWRDLDRPENSRTILEYVAANSQPGDFLNISPPYTYIFDYYWKGEIPVRIFYGNFDANHAPQNNYFYINSDRFQLNEKKMRKWHEAVASNYKRVWIFWHLGERNTEDREGVAREWMDANYERLETRRYRMFPYLNEHTGEMALYRIHPAQP